MPSEARFCVDTRSKYAGFHPRHAVSLALSFLRVLAQLQGQDHMKICWTTLRTSRHDDK